MDKFLRGILHFPNENKSKIIGFVFSITGFLLLFIDISISGKKQPQNYDNIELFFIMISLIFIGIGGVFVGSIGFIEGREKHILDYKLPFLFYLSILMIITGIIGAIYFLILF